LMSVWVTLEGHRQHTLMLLCLCEPRLVLVPLLQGTPATELQSAVRVGLIAGPIAYPYDRRSKCKCAGACRAVAVHLMNDAKNVRGLLQIPHRTPTLLIHAR
jgi:hypothetical protein